MATTPPTPKIITIVRRLLQHDWLNRRCLMWRLEGKSDEQINKYLELIAVAFIDGIN